MIELALELLALALLAVPALRLARSRVARAFPRLAAAAAAILLVYSAALALVASTAPHALRPAAAAALVLAAALAWRARPSFGSRRRLPPGSLALLSAGALLDPDFYAQQAERHGPVFKTAQLHPAVDSLPRRLLRPMVCIVGLERAHAFLERHETNLVRPEVPFSRYVPRGFIRYMAPADHARYRRLLGRALTHDVVAAAEALVTERTQVELAAALNGDTARVVHEIAFAAIARTVLGLEPGAPAYAASRELFRTVDASGLEFRRAATVRRAIAEIGRLAASTPRATPSMLDAVDLADPTVVGNLVFVVVNGSGDVAGLLAWILDELSARPDVVCGVRDDDSRALASCVVLETLRLHQSEYLFRRTTAPCELDGYRIPAGWVVRICVRESHRLAARFERPREFDPDRFRSLRPSAEDYCPFGIGSTACLGSGLTLAIGRAFVKEACRGFDWERGADAEPALRGWHWRPAAAVRLRRSAERERVLDQ